MAGGIVNSVGSSMATEVAGGPGDDGADAVPGTCRLRKGDCGPQGSCNVKRAPKFLSLRASALAASSPAVGGAVPNGTTHGCDHASMSTVCCTCAAIVGNDNGFPIALDCGGCTEVGVSTELPPIVAGTSLQSLSNSAGLRAKAQLAPLSKRPGRNFTRSKSGNLVSSLSQRAKLHAASSPNKPMSPPKSMLSSLSKEPMLNSPTEPATVDCRPHSMPGASAQAFANRAGSVAGAITMLGIVA
mmetsp:Transcript_120453/g.348143  ORF Transcript_120453/g.348143 Transcript_120453/m.348143 type:complete len:243 (-) Transcript_120453:611-1339(-)